MSAYCPNGNKKPLLWRQDSGIDKYQRQVDGWLSRNQNLYVLLDMIRVHGCAYALNTVVTNDTAFKPPEALIFKASGGLFLAFSCDLSFVCPLLCQKPGISSSGINDGAKDNHTMGGL